MSLDTEKARAEIMQRIRTNQRRGAITPEQRAAAADYLGRHSQGPRPPRPDDLLTTFRATAERMASTVELIEHASQAPAAVARYLTSNSLVTKAVAWPSLASLPWAGSGVDVEFRPPRRDESQGADMVGITGCFCALVETGTLVLLSGPDTPASTHLLPETHIAIVPASRLVPCMEDAFALMRTERVGEDKLMPRAINMVSGPSRTADIEQTIVIGAHGPYRSHIIVATAD